MGGEKNRRERRKIEQKIAKNIKNVPDIFNSHAIYYKALKGRNMLAQGGSPG